MHRRCATHTLAPLGALSVQILTVGAFSEVGCVVRQEKLDEYKEQMEAEFEKHSIKPVHPKPEDSAHVGAIVLALEPLVR